MLLFMGSAYQLKTAPGLETTALSIVRLGCSS
uniref:Uncharacterized protein n=1 Tax=Rhizophora mucronata TaxID=61149 RepID=A0A2P2NK65_RHIMU